MARLTLLHELGTPVWVLLGERRYAGYYAGRCGLGGIRHWVTAKRKGQAGWCVDEGQIKRRET